MPQSTLSPAYIGYQILCKQVYSMQGKLSRSERKDLTEVQLLSSSVAEAVTADRLYVRVYPNTQECDFPCRKAAVDVLAVLCIEWGRISIQPVDSMFGAVEFKATTSNDEICILTINQNGTKSGADICSIS